MLDHDEEIILGCVQMVTPNYMPLQSRAKIKAAVMRICVSGWTKGSDGFMTPAIAVAFGNRAIDLEIDALLGASR